MGGKNLAGYTGREPTWLKHRVLEDYADAWAMKLGSWASRIVYVDTHAGPWKSNVEDLSDTSIEIGIRALEGAANHYRAASPQNQKKIDLRVEAVFVEKDPESFDRLSEHLQRRRGPVVTHALAGPFGDNLSRIQQIIGRDPALIFVDPTGWTGVDMDFLARLCDGPHRDLLFNLMFNFVKRFLPVEKLGPQFTALFGDDVPPGEDEETLLGLYRERLKAQTGLPYTSDLAIAHPLRNRTWFRLILGASHPTALDLFRDRESRVIGDEAGSVRLGAKNREIGVRTGQSAFDFGSSTSTDYAYQRLNDLALDEAPKAVLEALASASPRKISFDEIWPSILERYHLTLRQLQQSTATLVNEGRVEVHRTNPNARTIYPDDRLWLPAPLNGGT